MTRSVLFLWILLVGGVFVADHRTSSAQQPQFVNREYQLKAGYFAYFGRYVTWPKPPFAGANNSFVIGILGNNPFGGNLVANRNGFMINAGKVKAGQIQGKKITVVQYKSVADFQRNYKPCHILFICRSSAPGIRGETATQRINAALAKTKGQPVLLVAEGNNMAESKRLANAGVMICYWNNIQSNQVSMIINRAAEKRERLIISSRLLGLPLVTVL